MPAISVVMPVYNCEDFIYDAVKSVLEQTFNDFELLIIDDSSTDKTLEIIKSFDDRRIVIIRKKNRSGLIDSLNIGLNCTKGKYMARMDGDDICDPERFEKQIDFLDNHSEITLCGSWYKVISTNEIVDFPTDHNQIKHALLNNCVFCHPSIMMRREFIVNNKLKYNEDFEAAEDYEMWTQIIYKGGITANIPEPLLQYRLHENQISNRLSLLQIKNSSLCRAKMLCLPLSHATDSDLEIGSLIINNKGVSDKKSFYEIIAWLNDLKVLNHLNSIYQDFDTYLDVVKMNFVTSFFYHLPKYKIGLIPVFFRFNSQIKMSLSQKEKAKIIIKCLVFWKSRTK